MKKTICMLPALALLMFAACSSEDAVTKDNTAQLNETSENAIGFDAYLNRTTTRAGKPGILTTSNTTSPNISLQASDVGFGVFGYYANGDLYSENATPNFMYNQWVKYDGDWKYEPIKYWPNEFGSSAISTGVDRVTFFAYAPYVGVDPTTGQLTSTYTGNQTTTGITSLTRNGKTGDPYVRYVGAFNPANCVDLCYGVAAADYKSLIGASDGANNVNKGEPYLNVAKPEINSKIYFDFKHALAKLTVQIDADVDVAAHADGTAPDELDNKTRIWVRSITFDGIAQRGYLNLNSGMWYEVMDNNKISHASVTIYDGRRDGAEATADDSYESPIGFNDALIQSETYSPTTSETTNGVTYYSNLGLTKTGVTASYQNLFGDAANGSLLVIPANEQLKVTIVYDVETADATLPTYLSDGVTKGSTIENKITKNITLGGTALKLESGKAYTLNLHLGMNSVKFDAMVSGWETNANSDADLPANVPIYAATKPVTAFTPTISSAAQAFEFKISGLDASEAVTATPTSGTDISALTQNAANASGVAYESITVTENKTVNDRNITSITWKGSSEKGVQLTLKQQAHPLELKLGYWYGDKDIFLESPATVDWTPSTGDIKTITIYKNGAPLTYTTDYNYVPNSSRCQITLATAATAGDVFNVTIQAGNAEPETVSFTIGQISYSTPETPVEVTLANAATPTVHKALTNTGDGVVTYTIAKTSGTGTGETISNDTGHEGEVKITGAAVDDEYTVTATVANSSNYYYLTTTATYKIKIIANP